MGIVELVGETTLSGIDRFIEDRKTSEWSDALESVEVVRLILGGKVVEFSENPSDGYRSYHNGPEAVAATVTNTFPPVTVVCEHITEGRNEWHDGSDILRISNASTGAVILDVGTDNVDDYYPVFVSDFSAEAIGQAD